VGRHSRNDEENVVDALPEHADVVIVGAGPVGLATAIALAHYGVDALLVDAAEERSAHSKAAVVHSRTLEVLREFGVADELVHRGEIVPYFAFKDRDRTLLLTDFSRLPTAYPYTLMVPQDVTEAVLDDRLRQLGGVVHRPYRVASLHQDAESVVLDVADDAGRVRRVRARYVIGADGAHSSVRHSLGVQFAGSAYGESFFLADVRMNWGLSREEVQLFFSQTGLVVVAPLPGGEHRIVATVPGPIESAGVADVQALLDQRGPRRPPARVQELTWTSNFRVNHRVASSYRRGRVFLAGDAAHVHSPAGGQGMNTGIQDSANLAWKLALVHHGLVGDELLDSYEAERRPIALDVVAQTHRLTRLATLHGQVQRSARNAVLGLAGRVPAVRRFLAQNLSELAVSYGQGRGRPGTRPGDRASALLPPVPPGIPAWRLLLPQNATADQIAAIRRCSEAQPVPVLVHRCDGVDAAQLVRPDGYLAAVGAVDRACDLVERPVARRSA
jgi:2-polyprenyl-6-methoxyphenol hydroxylase-like FAD-dependent oxidoreductase